LNARLEYEQEQLTQQKNNLRKMEETIDKGEKTMAEQREVVDSTNRRTGQMGPEGRLELFLLSLGTFQFAGVK